MDVDWTLHLWVDRPRGRHAIANPARDFHREIGEAAREVWGRPPRSIEFLDEPPDREHYVNHRRQREVRETEQAERHDRIREFEACKQQELGKLVDALRRGQIPQRLRRCRSERELTRELDALATERTHERLERESWRTERLRGNGSVPGTDGVLDGGTRG
jgi:hypothetical protein